eukprot:scaffold15524_cov149-Isochrysis_galbana.AAC.3
MVDHTVVRLSPRNPEDDAPWPVQVRSTSWYLLARSSSALVGHTALELSGNGGGGWKPQVHHILPVSLIDSLILQEGVFTHRHIGMHPLLEIIQMVEGAVEGHRVHVGLDPREAAALEKPPVSVTPTHHLGHDDFALESAAEGHQVDDQPALHRREYVDAIAAHGLGEGPVPLYLDGGGRLGQDIWKAVVDQRSNQLKEAFVFDLFRVQPRSLACIVRVRIHHPQLPLPEAVALAPREFGRVTKLESGVHRHRYEAEPILNRLREISVPACELQVGKGGDRKRQLRGWALGVGARELLADHSSKRVEPPAPPTPILLDDLANHPAHQRLLLLIGAVREHVLHPGSTIGGCPRLGVHAQGACMVHHLVKPPSRAPFACALAKPRAAETSLRSNARRLSQCSSRCAPPMPAG